MTHVEAFENGDDIRCILEDTWGPETEAGCPVRLEVEVELSKDSYGEYGLSIMAELDVKKCDKLGLKPINTGGQCLDTAQKHLAECGLECATLDAIVPIWKRWHNNMLRAGTHAQEEVIRDYRKDHPEWVYDYNKACEILSSAGLLFDKAVVNGEEIPHYKYGSSWLTEHIPEDVIRGLCERLDAGMNIHTR